VLAGDPQQVERLIAGHVVLAHQDPYRDPDLAVFFKAASRVAALLCAAAVPAARAPRVASSTAIASLDSSKASTRWAYMFNPGNHSRVSLHEQAQ
jgi:hypothetical protein